MARPPDCSSSTLHACREFGQNVLIGHGSENSHASVRSASDRSIRICSTRLPNNCDLEVLGTCCAWFDARWSGSAYSVKHLGRDHTGYRSCQLNWHDLERAVVAKRAQHGSEGSERSGSNFGHKLRRAHLPSAMDRHRFCNPTTPQPLPLVAWPIRRSPDPAG